MISRLFDTPVEVYRKVPTGEVDRYGKPIFARTLMATHKGRVEQVRSVEGQAFVLTYYRVFLPPTADVRAADELQANGAVYAVQGAPAVERVPGYRTAAHMLVTVKYTAPVAT